MHGGLSVGHEPLERMRLKCDEYYRIIKCKSDIITFKI